MKYKGFIKNKKKGPLTTLTSNDVFVVEKPQEVVKIVTGISVEVNPNVPVEKIITIFFSDGSSLSDTFIDNEGNNYSHPLKSWVNKSNLAGAQVIANITVDSLGHPTNWTIRNITPADIGASSIGHTHNYENPLTFVGGGATTVTRSGNTITITSTDETGGTTYTHPAKVWVNKSDLTGATVISNLTIDSLGHPTNWTTRNLTPADIGAQPAGTYDNYGSWNFGVNNETAEVISSGETVRMYPGDLIELTKSGNTVRIDSIPKSISSLVTGTDQYIVLQGSKNSNKTWYNIGGHNTTIGISSTSSTFAGDEIEGSFTGTGRLTIQAQVGMTLTWPDEFFTNTYPAGGVWGVKYLTPTHAVLFGKQIPIGI